jgi:hypothetical protein
VPCSRIGRVEGLDRALFTALARVEGLDQALFTAIGWVEGLDQALFIAIGWVEGLDQALFIAIGWVEGLDPALFTVLARLEGPSRALRTTRGRAKGLDRASRLGTKVPNDPPSSLRLIRPRFGSTRGARSACPAGVVAQAALLLLGGVMDLPGSLLARRTAEAHDVELRQAFKGSVR